MSKARLSLVAALLTLTSCASGPQPAPAQYQVPNLDIPATQLVECPKSLPALDRSLVGMDWSRAKGLILANHVAAAQLYQQCRDRQAALACTVQAQQGVTINGSRPTAREVCTPEQKGEGRSRP